jgi:hypothetical protein
LLANRGISTHFGLGLVLLRSVTIRQIGSLYVLTQLLYVSRSTIPADSPALERDISQILSVSYMNNEKVGITGLLLFSGGFFCQLVEGPEAAVDDTFSRVENDSRHSEIKVLMRQPTDWVYLPGFPMGCAGIERSVDPIIAEAMTLRGWTSISEAAPTVLYSLLSRVPQSDLVMTDPSKLLDEDLSL